MSADKQRAIAAKGGASLKPEQRSYAQNRELAAEAGRKGGLASGAARKARREAGE